MKVLTIIISYNFEKWIRPCLDSLLHSTYQTEILVIDNGSKDRTIDLIKKDYPQVRIISNGNNLGFGQANNIGMRIALQERFDAVFLLNQDAWIEKDTLGTLAELTQRYPDFGILSPTHLNGKGDRLDKGFASYTHTKSLSELPQKEELAEAEFINAAFWFIPVSTLKTVGGFSPLFYHYGEDKDYINRLHFHGLKIGYSPQTCGCHDREYRQVTRKAFFRSEYVYLLSEYANINRSYTKAFAYSVLACFKKSFLSLCRFRIKDCGTYAGLSFKLMMKDRKVRLVRHMTKEKQPHFITSLPPC